MTLTSGFKTTRDLFEKLRRDAALLEETEVTSDKFFNFAVTGYSLIDWVKNDPSVPYTAKVDLASLYINHWLRICGDIANASKHFSLHKRTPMTSSVDSSRGYGSGRFGMGYFGVGEEHIEITLSDGSVISVFDFVRNVISTWESFLNKHGF
jgi:hypothetical protein